jgi:hypothetical protein
MIHVPRNLAFAAFALLAAVSGCDCQRGGGVTQSKGELGVRWKDGTLEVTSRDAVYDFGKAAVGDRVPKQLIISNQGSGPLTVQTLELTEGDKVKVGEQAVEGAAFEVEFAETVVPAGEEKLFQMYYAPPLAADATQLKASHLSKLLLTSANAPEGENTAVITLKGEAEQGSCALPAELDFGKVTVGETFPAVIALTNGTSLDVTATAGNPEGTNGDQLAFGFADGSPRGSFTIAGNQSAAVTYTFSPTEVRAYTATVTLRAGPNCPAGTVVLKGEGTTDEVLTWTPSSLDFGYVSPGTQSLRKVTFTNKATAPVVLTQLLPSLPSDYFTQTEPGQAPQTFTVPGGGTPVEMTVVCQPSTLGSKNGTLTFKTGLKKTPTGTLQLACFGGGPDIKVVPAPTLAFGKVGFQAGTSVTRRLTVSNVGTKPPTATNTDANLKLGGVDASGVPGQAPLFAINAANGNTAQSEFSISWANGAYDPAKGIEATVGKNTLDLQVVVTPNAVGFKEADLHIFSNDPDEADTVIRVTADVQALQPCTYTVTPANLNFGLVTPPSFKELPFTIKNVGAAGAPACEVSGVDLALGGDPAYSITGGAIASKTLNPGESLQVVVKSNPLTSPPNNATVSLAGTVIFNINGTPAQGAVNLTTSVGPSCLTVAPDVLDFGTVKTGCSSGPRTFTVYNTCSSNISVGAASVVVGAPEFALVSAPPSGNLSPAQNPPWTFQARYSPQDIGPDQGAISINVTQNGVPVVYLVTLSGTGDATGLQTDTFVQDLKPKADILLVIDDSGSMQDKQNALSNNFGSFFQYANAAGVDYQLGVTTTDVDDQYCPGFGLPCTGPGPKGKLVGTATNPKVLTRSTPNVNTLYAQKVNVGTNGSPAEKGLEAAELALTPPLITTENLGFLRQDANLAVVVVSDAVDQSPQPTTYYLNRLLNVKGFNKANMFTFNIIGPYLPGGPSGSCSYDDPNQGMDTRYAFMASQTSGVKSEICNTNWSTTLQNLGKTAFGYRSSFYLNGSPDPSRTSTIKVTLDGVDVPAGSGAWAFNPVSNAIEFNTSNPPQPGQSLTVTYYTACF